MFAIVEMQGQQFNVEPNQKICVLNIADAKVGDEITFDKVLLVNNDGAITVGTPVVAGAKVVCEVSQVEVRGKKSSRKANRGIYQSFGEKRVSIRASGCTASKC